MVPLERIGLSTPPLPRVCSTTEPQRRGKAIVFLSYFCRLVKSFFAETALIMDKSFFS